MLTNPLKLLPSLVFVSLLSACTSSGLFSNYNQQMAGVKSAQQQGNFIKALAALPERSANDVSFNLMLLEKGRLEYLTNNYAKSQTDFEAVYQQVQEDEQAAKIQLSRGVEKLTAVVSNDNAIRYDVPYYEQSMLHSYQALNYLNQQDFSGALVEIRRANIVQNNALKANIKTLQESQERLAKEGVSAESLSSKYPSMNNVIGEVKNGFQNAYTFYLSGVLYEADGQANDAYIDYKKALEIFPHNVTLQKDVWRLATRLGMSNDIQLFGNRFSQDITQNKTGNQANNQKSPRGQIVIIAENGIIANKQEVSINLPIWTSGYDARFYNVALPVYQNSIKHYSGVSFTYQGTRYQSDEIVRLQALAAKHLQDSMPGIVARQIVRVIAKEEIRQRMSRKGGDIGNIVANLYNIASEKADTRSWSTLPDTVHILRTSLATGSHEIEFNVNGNIKVIKVDVNTDRQTLVKLTSIGNVTQYQSINL